MSKLRTFLKENSDVIWPALCLLFCGLTILMAMMKGTRILVAGNEDDVNINLNIIKNNMGVVAIGGAGEE